ncbi:MAG: hypothetical protein Q7R56_03225 [Nanoarchaeota archaeon]|nr:hypothetical protein [Nanoarchaeota archaeon]
MGISGITIIERFSFEELERRLRTVPLKGDQTIHPYEKARISTKTFYPQEVNPTTFYLLRNGLKLHESLRAYFLTYGIDILHLDGGITFDVEGLPEAERRKTLIPPIVELTSRVVRFIPQEGEIDYPQSVPVSIPILNDGAHRVMTARQAQTDFTAVFVSGASPEYPFYAHPNSWEQVKIVDHVPHNKHEKKMYIRPDVSFLYRDFGVLGCGTFRFGGSTT